MKHTKRRNGIPAISVANEQDFARRLFRDGVVGFGEAFMIGSWVGGDGSASLQQETDEAVDWLKVYASRLMERERVRTLASKLVWRWRLPKSLENTRDGARKNVAAHYDLPVEFFQLFLDPDLVYSCADFEHNGELHAAQRAKIAAVLDLASVKPGTRMLEIGCGWGALLVEASRRGAETTGITVSRTQFEHCLSQLSQVESSTRPKVLLEDYRDHSGEYDSVVSVEMIEAVGSAFWVDFFKQLDRVLSPNGTIALQVITFPDRRMKASLGNFSWVDRYIFPGGELISLEEMERILLRESGLELTATRRLTASYATTLRRWRHRFCGNLDRVRELGYTEQFIRIWALYLAYFEAGFRVRYLDVWQCQLRHRVEVH